ncbi:hypothetical protein M408DRAFT_60513 [Serendipita vermifera MAFF 305830]|uniref:Uncharacterized protein n=1 Tax=Serendipita vermifera MAFF 305830 TaxID=933852 RepID=A0A0C3BQV1_SERVB|nr:hypothetical protein M408DRAFT_60513 [Serendipita vermifera MAFF 305830]
MDLGSIPDRRDLVKSKPKAEQTDKQNLILAMWFFCALSKRPLQEPIVSCELGKLYNKDAIVEYLLDKTTYGDGAKICGHIKSLKDITLLTLTPNPTPVDPNAEKQQAAYVCPLTLKEMTGVLPFVYLATCGCVFSAAGLRALSSPAEIPSPSTPPSDSKDASTSTKQNMLCPQCSKPYDRLTDVRTLNPGPEEEATMREAMEARRAAKKAANKGKKRKATEMQSEEVDAGVDVPEHKRTKVAPSAAPKINASMISITKKVTESLAEEEAKRKGKMSAAVASLYGPKDGSKKNKETFMTMGTFTRVSIPCSISMHCINKLPSVRLRYILLY